MSNPEVNPACQLPTPTNGMPTGRPILTGSSGASQIGTSGRHGLTLRVLDGKRSGPAQQPHPTADCQVSSRWDEPTPDSSSGRSTSGCGSTSAPMIEVEGTGSSDWQRRPGQRSPPSWSASPVCSRAAGARRRSTATPTHRNAETSATVGSRSASSVTVGHTQPSCSTAHLLARGMSGWTAVSVRDHVSSSTALNGRSQW